MASLLATVFLHRQILLPVFTYEKKVNLEQVELAQEGTNSGPSVPCPDLVRKVSSQQASG